jgi:hypothetical protein
MAIFGGFTNRAEARAYADTLPEEVVLISVQNGPLGMPLTPLAYFPLTRSLIRHMYAELRRKPKDENEPNS